MTAGAIRRRVIPVSPEQIAARAAGRVGFVTNPFWGVEWSIAYVAFLAYMFAIISYKFQIGTASMTVALLALPMEHRGLRLPSVVLLMSALVGWAFVGLVMTSYPEVVADATTEFAKISLVVFVAANVLTTRNRFRLAVVLITIWWVLFPVRGTFISYFFGGGGVQGRAAWNFIYSNPNDLAGLCLLELSVALGILAVERHKLIRLGAQIAAGSIVVVIVLTQSRGGMIALAAFGLIFGRQYWRLVLNWRVLFSIAILIAVVVQITPDSAWRRFSTIKDATNQDAALMDPELVDLATRQDQGSSQQRLAIWKVATGIIADNPLTGVGLGAYPEAHLRMARRPGYDPWAGGRRDTHSTYLNIMAEIGIPGFLLFMGIIVVVIFRSHRVRKRLGPQNPAFAHQLFNMEVGLYGYMVAGIWGSYGAMVPTYVHVVLMVVATRLFEENVAALSTPVRRKVLPAGPIAEPVFPAAAVR